MATGGIFQLITNDWINSRSVPTKQGEC